MSLRAIPIERPKHAAPFRPIKKLSLYRCKSIDGKFSIAWHSTRVDRNESTGLARTYSHVRVTMKGWAKVCGRSKGVN
ncbi:unnamed protein product [Adineta ricciae]|uniref:Uncharacterized protein n=1 Tax=Adineta ricciae TaxID=249248 RepID=A0A814QBB4_ADIRI|nr:unnamed protein product [Adineta ricciae]